MAEMSSLVRDGSFTPEFDDLVSKTLRRWKVPGLSIAVINNDEVLAKVCHPVSPRGTVHVLNYFRGMATVGILTSQSSPKRFSMPLV